MADQPVGLIDKWYALFTKLADPIRDLRMEGLDAEISTNFIITWFNSEMFWDKAGRVLSRNELQTYEENIVRLTRSINEKTEQIHCLKLLPVANPALCGNLPASDPQPPWII